MTAPTDEPTGAMLLALHEYWTRKRGDRAMPSRADLDPLDMVPLLPNVFLVNVQQEPLDFVYRLLGTGIVARSLRDYTGMRVADIPAQRPPSRPVRCGRSAATAASRCRWATSSPPCASTGPSR